MPPASRRGRGIAACNAVERQNRTASPLLSLPEALFDRLLEGLSSQRDRAALARSCRALHASVYYADARVIVARRPDFIRRLGGDPAVLEKERWAWAKSAAARCRGRLTLLGFDFQDLRGWTRSERLRGVARAFHPGLRELALPEVFQWANSESEGCIKRLRIVSGSAARRAAAGLPPAFVTVGKVWQPDVSWATPGPAGEAPVIAATYAFSGLLMRDSAYCTAALASLPRGCSVELDGGRDGFGGALPGLTGAEAALAAEALVGRGVEKLTLQFSEAGPPLMSAAVAAGTAVLKLNHVSLDVAAAEALAGAVADAAAAGTLKHLQLYNMGGISHHLAALGARLQQQHPLESLSLSEDRNQGTAWTQPEFLAFHPCLSALLDRVAVMNMHQPMAGTIVVRSAVLRSLSLSFVVDDGDNTHNLGLVFEHAPALAFFRAKNCWPATAELLLSKLASDPNLPAMRVVEMGISEEGTDHDPLSTPLEPVAEGLRRALAETLSPAAAAQWRVVVAREAEGGEHGVVRAERRY